MSEREIEIEEYSEIVRGLKRVSDENRLDQVLSRCKELQYGDELYYYVQQELNVTFNTSDCVRDRELVDVLFYYLMRDEEPVREIQQLIGMIYYKYVTECSWCEICAALLVYNDVVFTQFYKRLGNKPEHVEYLINKHPQLLFNKCSLRLINTLNEHLPHYNLHQILLKSRDENEQTFMFYKAEGSLSDNLYRNKFDDLFELLSVRNKSGKTAPHVNSDGAYNQLLTRTTLNNQDEVNEPLSLRDNKTVYDTANDQCKKRLAWLKRQYEHNNYPLSDSPQVLILYNANDLPEAAEEAESIQQAFISVTRSGRIQLEKMGTKLEVLQLIAQRAANWNTSALIVCLMSLWDIRTIDDSDKNPITSIERAMCSDQLKERPKILITQSCQTRAGGRKRTHEEATCSNTDPRRSASSFVPKPPYEPGSNDFISVHCCVSGQESIRNVFIPYLAGQIRRSSKNDRFEDLVKNASFKMRQKGNKQIPIIKSTLRGNVCLKDQCPECSD